MATTGTSSPMRQINPSICPVTGDITYSHQLTVSSQTDKVRCTFKPVYVLPVIFVPGIMGSNLYNHEKKKIVWLLNGIYTAGSGMVFKTPGDRQKLLHPEKTKVYTQGETPFWSVGSLTTKAQFEARGWGEVSARSYKELLIWLEENLNGGGTNPNHARLNQALQKVADPSTWNAAKPFKPLTADEGDKAVQWFYPVHACGYNWLDDNAVAAKRLADRIDEVMALYNKKGICKQVILVTHSMGGLVARYCSENDNSDLDHIAKRDKIAGIVHGVMPAVGAAVAYRRCKVGMWDEDLATSMVIGTTGRDVTAVFAQAPGALQLLPSKQYPVPNWLEIRDADGNMLPDQPKTDDPYESIYKVRNKWWALINEEWLSPYGGKPIDWETYTINVSKAKTFHNALSDNYHTNTYGFYGSAAIDPKSRTVSANSFSRIIWTMEPGNVPLDKTTPSGKQIMGMGNEGVRQSGSNPLEVAAPDEQMDILNPAEFSVPVPNSYFRMRLGKQNSSGDGTVPAESGRFPINSTAANKVQQFFRIPGIAHEGAYGPEPCRHLTVYAINKIAAPLPLPTGGKA